MQERSSKQSVLSMICAGVVIVAALAYWNIRPDLFMGDDDSSPKIDFYATNSVTDQYDSQGKLDYHMTSVRIERMTDTSISYVTLPSILLYKGKEQPWDITSKRAEVSADGDEIEFITDVVIKRTDEKMRPIEITSTNMTAYLSKEYAHTTQPVNIASAQGTTNAVGMNAFLKEGKIELLSRVRGQYDAR